MTTGLDILEGLNLPQQEAVQTTDGPLLIIAGPGSGKTRVITHRIAYLIRVCGVNPYQIAAVTFTNKAAREMRNRLQLMVTRDSDSLTVGTFHSFCATMLRRNGSFLGLQSNYSIYDSDDQLNLIKRSLELSELDPKSHPPRAVQSVISKAKSTMLDALRLSQNAETYFEESCARVYYHYEELLAQNNAVDFDDLLMKGVQLLQGSEEIRERYQDQYQYLMVDEFQDTNTSQYLLTKLLTGEAQNICVVGDPDQSIYSWRNADIRNILSFQQDYPSTKTIALEQNYRSTSTILEAAKSLISSNGMRLQKDLFTENAAGDPITIHEAYDEQEEAGFVISQIRDLRNKQSYKLGECAVMYRINAQSRSLEEACIQQGIQYRLVGGVRFYQRREIKDLMGYMHLIHNPQDEVNLTRVINVPPRGIGAKSLKDFINWCHDNKITLYEGIQRTYESKTFGSQEIPAISKRAVSSIANFGEIIQSLVTLSHRLPITELIDQVLEQSGLRQSIQNSDDNPIERWENILELKETAREFDSETPPDGLSSFLERLSLVAEVDSYEDAEDSITLITLHQAKGLEFPVVFIVGMEEGLLPHSRSMENELELEEERRLCYVGFTRAERRLYLLRAFRRGFMGNSGPTMASRFLREIPSSLVTSGSRQPTNSQLQIRSNVKLSESPPPKPQPPRLVLSTGDEVKHSVFGEGIVLECRQTNEDHEVTIQFSGDIGIKRLLLSFAPLEKVSQ